MNFEPFAAGLTNMLGRTSRRFFRPLWAQPFCMWSFIGIVVLYLYISTGLAELATQNCRAAHVVAAEMRLESGPYSSAAVSHAKILRAYVRHMKERHLALLLALLHPECSPEKRLAPIVTELENTPVNEDSAQKVIARAGEMVDRLCECRKGVADRSVIWFTSERLPKWLERDLNEALVKSHKCTEKLQENRTFDNALEACQANRETLLLFVLAYLGYGNHENITQFLADVERAHCLTKTLVNETPNGENKDRLTKWARSEERRAEILKAMLCKKFDEIITLTNTAVEDVYEDDAGESFAQ